jgi:hypothetical protein
MKAPWVYGDERGVDEWALRQGMDIAHRHLGDPGDNKEAWLRRARLATDIALALENAHAQGAATHPNSH